MSQAESELSRKIMSALRAQGAFACKYHGNEFSMSGVPDILVCRPEWVNGEWRGMFYALETKLPEGDEPTKIQLHRHNQISAAGGKVYVVHSVEEAMRGCGYV